MLNALAGEAILGQTAASALPIYMMIYTVNIWSSVKQADRGAGSYLIIDGGFYQLGGFISKSGNPSSYLKNDQLLDGSIFLL